MQIAASQVTSLSGRNSVAAGWVCAVVTSPLGHVALSFVGQKWASESCDVGHCGAIMERDKMQVEVVWRWAGQLPQALVREMQIIFHWNC